MMKHKIAFIIAGALLVLAAFMKFAMIGYGFLALTLCAAAAAVVLFAVLPAAWKIVLAALIAVFLIVFCYWEVRIVKAARVETPADADCLIVLGCGVRGTTPSIAMKNRTDAAATYLKANPRTIAICSGGQGPGEDVTEAQAMKSLLVSAGVDPSRVLLEERSTSTDENLRFSAEVIRGLYGAEEDAPFADVIAGKNILICSSAYHIFRAQYLAEDILGVRLPGLPAPGTLPVSAFNYYLREAAGMMVIHFLR